MSLRNLESGTASHGRVWWYRIPLLIPFVWILLGHLMDSEYVSIFAGINLVIHEGGHLFFMLFGIDFFTGVGLLAGLWVLRVMATVNGAEGPLELFGESPST